MTASARLRRAIRAGWPAVLVVVGLLLAWEAWATLGSVQPYLLPAPSRIWRAFLGTAHLLPDHAVTTLTEAIVGLALAAILGAAVAILLAAVPASRRPLYPLLVVSQNIPLVVLAPLMIVWFGLGLAPKVALVALVGFFPIAVATTDALLGADRDYIDLVRSMGAGRRQILRDVLIPSALPGFFAGLKISASYAVLAAVFAEWIAASSGLGLYISRSDNAFRTDQVFVGVAIVALASICLFGLVSLAAQRVTPWITPATKEGQ